MQLVHPFIDETTKPHAIEVETDALCSRKRAGRIVTKQKQIVDIPAKTRYLFIITSDAQHAVPHVDDPLPCNSPIILLGSSLQFARRICSMAARSMEGISHALVLVIEKH
jgi:hypothetical protein